MQRGLQWRALVILVVLAVAGAVLYRLPLKLGLDLRGGVHIVLEAQDTPETKVNPDVMARAKVVIDRRVNGLGVAEPVVQFKGNRQIIVDLPGLRDPQKAIEVIGKTAVLEFRDPEGKVVATGADFKKAQLEQDQYGRPAVGFEFNAEGAKRFGEMTAANIGRQAPIVLDGQVISNPRIQSAITEGRGIITGSFSYEEAKNLVLQLNAGALPVPLKVVENRSVGPTLGREAIDQSFKAAVVGVILVLLYMLMYYRLPGLMADLALGAYVLLVLAAMAGLRATLTLPGIAGFILSVGMAVDANVLIFERIKEELQSGKQLRPAIAAGFHRAFSSIFDSNVTTLIAAGVLFFLGTGPIKGFAVTLSLGILISMFTAIVVTRFLLSLFVERDPDKYAPFFGAVRG
ncbi:MAG TPA: protein translocase subunit SecD [Firmicutes bacterium]|nr:protein translocase subunit SecD [Bacillota bacterium]